MFLAAMSTFLIEYTTNGSLKKPLIKASIVEAFLLGITILILKFLLSYGFLSTLEIVTLFFVINYAVLLLSAFLVPNRWLKGAIGLAVVLISYMILFEWFTGRILFFFTR